MHILTLILAGLALLVFFVVIGRLTGYGLRRLLPAYLALWLFAALVNLWVGVRQAGYSLAEEALVLIPVFGGPALAAFLLARRSR